MSYHWNSFERHESTSWIGVLDQVMARLTIGMLGVCFYKHLEYWCCVAMIGMVHDSIHRGPTVADKSVRHAGMHLVACASALYMLTL